MPCCTMTGEQTFRSKSVMSAFTRAKAFSIGATFPCRGRR
jgi:hypothetical protein